MRRRSDAQLAELLRRRPDLSLPAPADLATLASRVGVRTSVQRAVDSLDALRLAVLDAIVLTSQHEAATSAVRVAAYLPGVDLAGPLDDLRTAGLIWGDDDRLYPVAHVLDALGPYPAGLGRPALELLGGVSDVTLAPVLRTLGLPPAVQPRSAESIAGVLGDPERLATLIAACDRAERDVLRRLSSGGPPIGAVRDALLPASLEDGATPPHRLIARGLLVPIDTQTVELPREVGLALRGERPLGDVAPVPPPVPVTDGAGLDRLGTTAALDTLRHIAALGEAWTAAPPAVLRSGGVGVRDLRRSARELDVDEPTVALLVEVAGAAGLIGPTHGIDPVFLPTPAFDAWLAREPAPRWVALAGAWLSMTRQPSLVGQRDERDRLITVLGPDVERGTIPALRRTVLGCVADLPPDAAPRSRADVLTLLAWQSPRRASAQRRLAESVLAEADLLGVTAAGGLTGYGRALLAGAASAASDALSLALPEPVDHFLVQPDLTVVVPGPPASDLAGELALVADLESSGGASVYRVTEASVRRALDAGRGGSDLARLFAERSRTPIPQALTYLIEDVARRHGVLRAGPAGAYLRCDDEALLARVLGDRNVEALGLRRIAPTVVVAGAPVARILDVLREAGYAPAAESPDGALVALSGEAPRAPSRPASRLARTGTTAGSEAQLGELVRRMRAGDQLAEITKRVAPGGQRVPGVTSAATLGLLREAIRGGRRIWLGYVDQQGRSSQRTIEPISMAAGTLRGHDLDTGRLEAFALHHITGVGVVEDG